MHDFSAVTPESLSAQIDDAISAAEELAVTIGSGEEPTYDTVLGPIDAITNLIRSTRHQTAFLRHVHPDAAVREAAYAADDRLNPWLQDVAPWSVELAFRPEVYEAVEAFAATEEAAQLTGQRRRLLDYVRSHLRLVGHELVEKDRARVKELSDRLLVLESEFNKNIADDTSSMLLAEEDTDGLPDAYLEGLSKDEASGQYRLTMAYPDYVPFMENSSRRDLRHELRLLFANRAAEPNRPLLEEAVAHRLEIAELLGFDSWADRVLSTRMAGTKQRVDDMYESLIPPLTTMATAELEKMAALLEADTGDRQVQVWDWNYYDTNQRKTDYGIDPLEVAEYFPLQSVLDGMFELTSEVFGLEYEEVDVPVWHEDVRAYRVTDRDSGDLIGHFYLDLFPREGKYTHAAVFPGVPGYRREDGSFQTPITAMACNFTKPTENAPSLLQHSEVETLFHEFGHILHEIVGAQDTATISGTYTEVDFVEAPSQIMQHWIWRPEILRRFATHHETSESIPSEMVQGLVAARRLNSGRFYLRQIQLGQFDQRIHGPEPKKDLDLINRETYEISLLPFEEGTFSPGNFGHLLGGYDSGYYGYMWSEVFGDDMFSRFEEEGVTNPEVGMDYRNEVIGRGGSIPADEILVNFLGREPNNHAFLRKVGIE